MANFVTKFFIEYLDFPFNDAKVLEFESFIQTLAKALHHDDFIRKAYYPVFVGSANFSPPSVQQRAEALQHLDRYIQFLPTISIEPSSLQELDYRWTQRPHAGDATIHLDGSLCVALANEAVSTLAKLLIACTVLHEVAHTYGLNTRPDPYGYSPKELSVTGYEERVNVAGVEIVVGEAGYVVENEIFGGILYALIPEGAKYIEYISEVLLERSGVFYHIPVTVVGNWLRDVCFGETRPLWDMEGLKVSKANVGFRRCKLSELARSTHHLATTRASVRRPAVTPEKLCRVERCQDRRPNPQL